MGCSEPARHDPKVFGLNEQMNGSHATVEIRGELDAYNAPKLEQLASSLYAQGAETLTLDVAHTTFVDSSGLRTMLTMRDRAEHRNGTFLLAQVPDVLKRLLEITGLTEAFATVDDASGHERS